MRAYKVFVEISTNENWRLIPFGVGIEEEYSFKEGDNVVDTIHSLKGELELPNTGFSFYRELFKCLGYYSFNPKNKVVEIEILGDIIGNPEWEEFTNKFKIIRELSWGEVLRRCNSGSGNSGYGNSGDCNVGFYNSGDYNTGGFNSGDYNTGEHNLGEHNTGSENVGNYNVGDCNFGAFNTGSENVGNYNVGDCNFGYKNSGDGNVGNYNSGDFNTGNCNFGTFNTITPKMSFFNKVSEIKYEEWIKHPAYFVIQKFYLIPFIPQKDMTEKEKENFPRYMIDRGYLKKYDYKIACNMWWDKLTEDEKEIFQTIPNFDKDVFFEITGIEV